MPDDFTLELVSPRTSTVRTVSWRFGYDSSPTELRHPRTEGGFHLESTTPAPLKVGGLEGSSRYLTVLVLFLTPCAPRNRAAPYPPQTLGPVLNELESHDQVTSGPPPHDTKSPDDRSANRPDIILPKVNPRPTHLSNRTIVSESGAIYTPLPYNSIAQDLHPGPAVADIEPRENTPPNIGPTPTKRVTFADGPPSVIRGEVIASEDADEAEKMAALAKRFLEYVKNAVGDSGSGEEERE